MRALYGNLQSTQQLKRFYTIEYMIYTNKTLVTMHPLWDDKIIFILLLSYEINIYLIDYPYHSHTLLRS